MDSNSLSLYYDKLSEIRAKVLNKHATRTKQSTFKYYNENFQTLPSARKEKQTHVESAQERKPLENKVDKESNIMDRVKELDCVNDKIKLILASRRQPSASAHQRNKSSYRQDDQATPKRMTSLFQNEKSIVESKVEPRAVSSFRYEKKSFQLSKEEANRIKINSVNANSLEKRRQFSSINKNKMCCEGEKTIESQRAFFKQNISQQKHFAEEKSAIAEQRTTFSFEVQEERAPSSSIPLESFQQPQNQIRQQPRKPITKRLVELLVKQIQLDTRLRTFKQKFQNFKAPEKQKILKQKVSKYGVNISDQEFSSWISVSNEQCDPFLEITPQTNFDFEQMAAYLVASWEFWNNQLKESLTISDLQAEGFKIQDIDLGEKGYISVQDLVCFVNLNSDSFFRNRDVCNMFKRWNKTATNEKGTNRVKYQNFLSFMAK